MFIEFAALCQSPKDEVMIVLLEYLIVLLEWLTVLLENLGFLKYFPSLKFTSVSLLCCRGLTNSMSIHLLAI